jgi:hypothetical protein
LKFFPKDVGGCERQPDICFEEKKVFPLCVLVLVMVALLALKTLPSRVTMVRRDGADRDTARLRRNTAETLNTTTMEGGDARGSDCGRFGGRVRSFVAMVR